MANKKVDKNLIVKGIIHELINIRRVTGGDFVQIVLDLVAKKASKEEFEQCLAQMNNSVEMADKSIRRHLELIY